MTFIAVISKPSAYDFSIAVRRCCSWTQPPKRGAKLDRFLLRQISNGPSLNGDGNRISIVRVVIFQNESSRDFEVAAFLALATRQSVQIVLITRLADDLESEAATSSN